MDKVVEILKIANYDKFKCTADKCKFTCCEGWDIGVDADTYNKWKKESKNFHYILKSVMKRKIEDKEEYFISKETHESCPLLDEKGLCNIVKSHGEENLSLTCHNFPRIENILEDKKELSLTCACPEVVELISGIKGKISMVSENNINTDSDLLELEIRKVIIDIIQQEKFTLEEKLIISFNMLVAISEDEIFSREDSLLEELGKYKNLYYIEELIAKYHKKELKTDNSIEEINYLFLDIIQNYKEVSVLKLLLKDISNFAEEVKIITLSAKWQTYKDFFKEYNHLIENCIISNILSNCVSDDIDGMIICFEMIILEYLLMRHAVFLKFSMNENIKIDVESIKNYIVAFSRIIGNNSEAVTEFLRYGFGDEILDIEYLCGISLF